VKYKGRYLRRDGVGTGMDDRVIEWGWV